MEVLSFDHIPDSRVLDLDLLQSDLTHIDASLDLAILVTRATLFNCLKLFSKLLDTLQNDINKLDIETRSQESVQTLLLLSLLFVSTRLLFALTADNPCETLLKSLPYERL